MKLIIYMPALNEEEGIREVIKELPKDIPGIDTVEVLVVDDGSTDKTAEYAKKEGAVVVSHNINKGVGSAFHTAVNKALSLGADVLVSIDSDRQFNAKQIPNIIIPILEDKADMVTGNRFEKGVPENMSKTKYWGNQQMSRLISVISGQKFRDVSCGFRAYNREALLNLNLFGKFTYTQETILDIVNKGLRVIEYPVDVIYFPNRKSRVAGSIIKYAMKTSKIIVRTLRDYQPMRFFGGIGVFLMFIGLIFETFLFVYYVMEGQFTPYKSVGFIGLGFLILGLLVFFIGLLADMLNRMRINQERLLYELKKENYGK